MKGKLKKLVAGLMLMAGLAGIIALTTSQSAFADLVDLPYDWVFQVETKPLPKQFEYQGSPLKPIEKIDIKYHPAKEADNKTTYEYLWYHDGKPLGLERTKKFDLPQGDSIAIQVKHKNGSSTTGEEKAAANAILRVTLDAYLNKNAVALVKLPADSFYDISGHLQSQGLQVAPDMAAEGTPLQSSLTLFLVSEPDGIKQTLYRP